MRARLFALCVLAAGCAAVSESGGGNGWLRVAHDSLYDIAIDAKRITSPRYHTYLVWYRTDHAVTHLYRGEPFNREIVQSYLRCGDLSFKVASVDMSMRGGRTIVRQRSGPNDLNEQPWRHVAPGTIEASAARATCDFARERELSIAEHRRP